MTATNRFVVVYRSPEGPLEYYGPFVSERLADEFVAEKLPEDSVTAVKPLLARQEVDN